MDPTTAMLFQVPAEPPARCPLAVTESSMLVSNAITEHSTPTAPMPADPTALFLPAVMVLLILLGMRSAISELTRTDLCLLASPTASQAVVMDSFPLELPRNAMPEPRMPMMTANAELIALLLVAVTESLIRSLVVKNVMLVPTMELPSEIMQFGAQLTARSCAEMVKWMMVRIAMMAPRTMMPLPTLAEPTAESPLAVTVFSISTNSATLVLKMPTNLELPADPLAPSLALVMAFLTHPSNAMTEASSSTETDALPLVSSNAVTEEEMEMRSATMELIMLPPPTPVVQLDSLLVKSTSVAGIHFAVMVSSMMESSAMMDL